MFNNTFFKTSNAYICINFSLYEANLINELDGKHLTNIHVFVFNPNYVDVKKLVKFANPCRRRKIKIIIHCFNKKDVYVLKRRMKGIYKDKYFHFQENDKMKIVFSDKKYMIISYRQIIINSISKYAENITLLYDYKE